MHFPSLTCFFARIISDLIRVALKNDVWWRKSDWRSPIHPRKKVVPVAKWPNAVVHFLPSGKSDRRWPTKRASERGGYCRNVRNVSSLFSLSPLSYRMKEYGRKVAKPTRQWAIKERVGRSCVRWLAHSVLRRLRGTRMTRKRRGREKQRQSDIDPFTVSKRLPRIYNTEGTKSKTQTKEKSLGMNSKGISNHRKRSSGSNHRHFSGAR